MPGFNVRPPANDPPGFRVAAERTAPNELSNDHRLASFGNHYADVAPPAGIGPNALIRPIEGGDRFNILGQRPQELATSFLFPRMEELALLQADPHDSLTELDTGSGSPLPDAGLRVDDRPDFRVVADNSTWDSSQDHSSSSSTGYGPQATTAMPFAIPSADGIRADEDNVYARAYFPDDPIYHPPLPQDPVQEALDQIKRLYARFGGDWSNRIGKGAGDGPTIPQGGEGASGRQAAIDVFDPRHIVPTSWPPRTHNGGPPLRDPSTRSPAQSPRGTPNQPPQPAIQPPDNSAAAAGAAAATGIATEVTRESEPIDPKGDEKLEAWRKVVRERGGQAPDGQYMGPDGLGTAVGIRLNPRLPEPSAGRGYLPAQRHLRNGYRGELELANRIVAALPDEIVIHYGMPAGRQGPDVISLSPNGAVSVWDSKWRSGQRSISPGARAHQGEDSPDGLKWELRRLINAAVRSGHLAPDIAAKARKNVDAGNFDIYTIGTGNAHGGVAEPIRNSIRSNTQRQ